MVSPLPSTKYSGNFLVKSFLDGQTMFYMKTDDQVMQGGKLMVTRRSSQVSFPVIDLDLSYSYNIIRKVSTTKRRLNLKNTFCTLCLWGWGFHVKPVFFFKNFLVVTCSLMS